MHNYAIYQTYSWQMVINQFAKKKGDKRFGKKEENKSNIEYASYFIQATLLHINLPKWGPLILMQ